MNLRPRAASAKRLVAALALAGLAACDSASASDRTNDRASGAPPAAVGAVAATADSALLARADLGRIRGNSASTVWLVVVSDFQCPYCKVWHDETGPLIERDYVRTGKIRVAYLNFPITTHRNAWPAHEAAMCGAEQGKFWPVADAIFATQAAWKGRTDAVAYFDSLTRPLDLDHPRLRRCIAAGGMRPLIQADFDRSLRTGVGSTPTFFVGGQMIIGAQPYAAFQRALDAALAAAAAPARPKPAG